MGVKFIVVLRVTYFEANNADRITGGVGILFRGGNGGAVSLPSYSFKVKGLKFFGKGNKPGMFC